MLQVACEVPGDREPSLRDLQSCNNLLSYKEQSTPRAEKREPDIFSAGRFGGSEHLSSKKVLLELDIEKEGTGEEEPGKRGLQDRTQEIA